MHAAHTRDTSAPPSPAPFSAALLTEPDGSGAHRARLGAEWTVAGGRLHGGVMLALVTRTGLVDLAAHTGGPVLDPLVVGAEFLRAPEQGSARIETEVVKVGRRVSVVRSTLFQNDRPAVSATVSAGRLPEEPPLWSDAGGTGPGTLPVEPPSDALRTSADVPRPSPLALSCDIRLDPATFRRADHPRPVLRGWVRPLGEPADVLFALFTGDALPPVVVNLGLPGWAPTVQLTALLRARPAPGWLRVEMRSREVAGSSFDVDATVLDARGRLVCQGRQLALLPLP
jgi:acyl-coenzyme A thioesterase PaaI-like protein